MLFKVLQGGEILLQDAEVMRPHRVSGPHEEEEGEHRQTT